MDCAVRVRLGYPLAMVLFCTTPGQDLKTIAIGGAIGVIGFGFGYAAGYL